MPPTITGTRVIRPRGNSFQVYFRVHGVRYRKQFGTRVEAEQWAAEQAARPGDSFAKPTPKSGKLPQPPKGGATLQWLYDFVCEWHWRGKRAGQTMVYGGRDCVEILGPARQVSTVDESDAEKLVRELWRRGKGTATINVRLASLSRMLSLAYANEWIQRWPRIGTVPHFYGMKRPEDGSDMGSPPRIRIPERSRVMPKRVGDEERQRLKNEAEQAEREGKREQQRRESEADLQTVVAAWGKLPDGVRREILAMVRAAAV